MSGEVSFTEARGPQDMLIFAIGDIHGRLDLLQAMHQRIFAEIAERKPSDWRVIHLGDYMDRGPDSSGVLQWLVDAQARDPRMLAIAGNHDVGMLDFLRDPQRAGLFARYGGVDTARSYGIDLDTKSLAKFGAGHEALVRAIPPSHVSFLRDLSFRLEFGDFFFCHAGIRPTLPLEDQSNDDLVWIREDFLDWTKLHPKVVVHGHTPVASGEIHMNRVNVDTGAFKTNRLTALMIDGAQKRLIEVSPEK